MTVFAEDCSWFRQLSRRFAQEASRHLPSANKEWLAFDLADSLEQGLARELTTQYTAACCDQKARALTVVRSEDRLEYLLMGEDDQPLMLAIARPSARRFDIYATDESGNHRALGPSFELAFSSDTLHWELCAEQCGNCVYKTRCSDVSRSSGKRCLLRAHQARRAIGPGFAMSMGVELPSGGEVWCNCQDRGAPCSDDISPRVPLVEYGGSCLKLESLKPRWSSRLRSLTLDFDGRCSRASAKNFQLAPCRSGDAACPDSKDTVLQFGKMRAHTFCLDFKAPLGVVQSFALALTTAFWV